MGEILRQIRLDSITEKIDNTEAVVEATRELVKVAIRRLREKGTVGDWRQFAFFEDVTNRRSYILIDNDVIVVNSEGKSKGLLNTALIMWATEFNEDGDVVDERRLTLPRDPLLVNPLSIGCLLETGQGLRGIDPASIRELTYSLENAQYSEFTSSSRR